MTNEQRVIAELRGRVEFLENSITRARARIASLELALSDVADREPQRAEQIASLSTKDRLLTKQERLVLRCFLACPNDKKVARAIGSKTQTVRNQVGSIVRKLRVGSREEMILRMLSTGTNAGSSAV